MASAMPSSTRLTTNSPLRWILRVVSFGEPSSFCCKPRTTKAGGSENTLKKENGAALTIPSALLEVTKAIGRGTTAQELVALARLQLGEIEAQMSHSPLLWQFNAYLRRDAPVMLDTAVPLEVEDRLLAEPGGIEIAGMHDHLV